jgi:hypothetical protein
MAIINKVTKLFPQAGSRIDEDAIQAHIDEQNANGYYLIAVTDLIGWYRFFWAKEV